MGNLKNIGAASKASGVSAKMIRQYEEIGLLPKAKRSTSGYRLFDENDIHSLRFVRRCRELGFSMKETKKLLVLWKNRSRCSSDVKKLTLIHLTSLESKIAEFKKKAKVLRELSKSCAGDHRQDCPILTQLAK